MTRFLFSRRTAVFLATFVSLVAMPATALANVAEPYRAPSDRTAYARALQCMTQAIYYEAASESQDGQRAVAQVVLNRVRSRLYPDSVCGVVYQGSHRRTGCQFSFTCDGALRRAPQPAAWARIERIAAAALGGYVFRPVGLSLNYHTTAIRPYWAPSLIRHTVVGAHIFYRQPGHTSLASFSQVPAAFEPLPGTSVAPAARAVRTASAPNTRRLPSVESFYRPARVEQARVERPVVQRAIVERPPGFGTASARRARPQRTAAASTPRPAVQGPRTTVEGGVRVARGR